MVDVVWNDGSASGDFTSYKLRGDVVLGISTKLFPGCWHCMALVCSCNNQYVGFPEWQYIPFR
jgi:hypothetical protein